MEMRFLRLNCGLTLHGRVTNAGIRERMSIATIREWRD